MQQTKTTTMPKSLKILTVGFALFSCISHTEAQSDLITTAETCFGTTIYIYDGKAMSLSELNSVLHQEEAAHRVFKKAKKNYYLYIVTGFVGGSLVGWELGTYWGGAGAEPLSVPMLLAGFGLGMVSQFLFQAYQKRTIQAVNIYNNLVKARSDDYGGELEED